MPDITTLNVLLHNQEIGTITLLPDKQIIFAFNQSYINDTNRPSLSLSFKDKFGQLITDIRPSRQSVPPFFSNLLPEGHMRDYLAQKADVNAKREFFLLWVLGRDLPGAITISPVGGDIWPESPATDKERENTAKNALRFSLAGVQLKFSALLQPKSGLTIPAQGIGGSWIVKLPSARFANIPENEYAMMSLAAKIGMDVPQIKLVELRDIANLPANLGELKGPALAIKRFDRSDNGPVHIEDFAQVFRIYPDNKYERASYKNIAEVINIEAGEAGTAEFIRRLVYNTLIGNADMHLKNWSLIYPDKKQAALAPAYDFVSTIPYIEDKTMALNYVKSKNMAELSLTMLSYFASKARLSENLVLSTAKETVKKFMEFWHQEKAHLPLTQTTINIIEKNFARIVLTREVGVRL